MNLCAIIDSTARQNNSNTLCHDPYKTHKKAHSSKDMETLWITSVSLHFRLKCVPLFVFPEGYDECMNSCALLLCHLLHICIKNLQAQVRKKAQECGWYWVILVTPVKMGYRKQDRVSFLFRTQLQ